MMAEGLDEFLKDREEALLSLSLGKVNAYREKYGEPPMKDAETAWAAIHKARVVVTTIPEAEKEISRKWLMEHGFTVPTFTV